MEYQGHRSKVKVTNGFVCFCVHDTASTRGQYLALTSLTALFRSLYNRHLAVGDRLYRQHAAYCKAAMG